MCSGDRPSFDRRNSLRPKRVGCGAGAVENEEEGCCNEDEDEDDEDEDDEDEKDEDEDENGSEDAGGRETPALKLEKKFAVVVGMALLSGEDIDDRTTAAWRSSISWLSLLLLFIGIIPWGGLFCTHQEVSIDQVVLQISILYRGYLVSCISAVAGDGLSRWTLGLLASLVAASLDVSRMLTFARSLLPRTRAVPPHPLTLPWTFARFQTDQG